MVNININCIYNDQGAWCKNKAIKKSWWGIGARECIEFQRMLRGYGNLEKCQYREGYPKPPPPPLPKKKAETVEASMGDVIHARRTPPTKPGMYYYVSGQCTSDQFLVCQVVETKGSGLFGEIVTGVSRFYFYKSVSKMKGKWFGPLPKPAL